MTDERLIEEAAAQRYPHRNVFLEGMAYMAEERSRIPLREAFVAGAKWQANEVHTPTDDEREALRVAELDVRQAAYQQDRTDWFLDHEYSPEVATNAFFRGWDAAVAYGFRPSSVQEPSDAEWRAGEQSVADAMHFSANPEPQGEPSDAQIEAAAREILPDGLGLWEKAKPEWQAHARRRAVAALRAAAEVGGER